MHGGYNQSTRCPRARLAVPDQLTLVEICRAEPLRSHSLEIVANQFMHGIRTIGGVPRARHHDPAPESCVVARRTLAGPGPGTSASAAGSSVRRFPAQEARPLVRGVPQLGRRLRTCRAETGPAGVTWASADVPGTTVPGTSGQGK